MPVDPVTGGLIVAGISAAGGATNAAMSGRMNRKQREWSEKMYGRQYQDNINLWHMQNEYNSPEKQMQRYESAGLNKHAAIGGKANAGAAGQVSTPDVQGVQYRTPEWGNAATQGVTSYFDNFLNTEIKQAQYDNLKSDNLNKLLQAELIRAQTVNTTATSDRSTFDLSLEKDLRDTTIEARREAVRKAKADTSFRLSENERRQAMHAPNLTKAYEDILNSRIGRAKTRQEIEVLKKRGYEIEQSGQLKRLEKELLRMGITKGDPWYFRMLSRYLPKVSVAEDPKYPLLYDKNIIPNK